MKIRELLPDNSEEFLENVSEELKTLINTNHELTDEIAKRLIINLAFSRNNKGFDEKEAEKILKWADTIFTGLALLKSVLNFDVLIDYSPEKDDIVFSLSSRGEKKAENDLTKNPFSNN